VAITEIVNPAYQELVLGAGDALERSAGATHVHLLWLELLHQLALGNQLENLLRSNHGFAAQADRIAQHLRLAAAKQQAGSFLLRIQAVQDKDTAGSQRPRGFPK
jgi:hypothetical protein